MTCIFSEYPFTVSNIWPFANYVWGIKVIGSEFIAAAIYVSLVSDAGLSPVGCQSFYMNKFDALGKLHFFFLKIAFDFIASNKNNPFCPCLNVLTGALRGMSGPNFSAVPARKPHSVSI